MVVMVVLLALVGCFQVDKSEDERKKPMLACKIGEWKRPKIIKTYRQVIDYIICLSN